jgi:hypothetical protein
LVLKKTNVAKTKLVSSPKRGAETIQSLLKQTRIEKVVLDISPLLGIYNYISFQNKLS